MTEKAHQSGEAPVSPRPCWFDEEAHGRPERRNAAEFDRRILSSARTLFAERGIDAVSMHQIAQAAGVGQGTLYRRYAHKGELCMDLLGDAGWRFRRDVESYLADTATGVAARRRLDGVLSRYAAFMEENGGFLSAMVDASCGAGRDMQFRHPMYRWLHAAVSGLLADGIAEGELPALNVALTADAVLAALDVDLYLFQRRERGCSPDEILQGLRRIYVDGLCRPRP